MREVPPDIRWRTFLSKGLLPIELPPPFGSDSLARHRRKIIDQLPNLGQLQNYYTQYENYSLPRFSANRRRLAVVNPIPFLVLSKILADNWIAIKDHLRHSRISLFRPVFDLLGPRTFFGVDFDLVRAKEHEILGRFDEFLRSDISQYYPTIYTHSIPWALLGKAHCKRYMNTRAFRVSWQNLLDVFVRNMQDRQTAGIPIGPETSRILAEILSVAIDQRLQRDLDLYATNALRYVDDYVVAIRADRGERDIRYSLSKSLAEYQLEPSFEKTRRVGIGSSAEPSWTEELAQFRFGSLRQKARLDQYFDLMFRMADRSDVDHVIRYGIKRSTGFNILNENWAHYQLLLQSAVRRSRGAVISDYCQILVNARADGKAFDPQEARTFIQEIIELNAPMQNVHEVAWCLFLAKGLRLGLSNDVSQRVIELENSVCSLLLVDLFNRNLIPTRIAARTWRHLLNSDGLRSASWLFVYEIHRKQWLGLQSHGSFVANDPYFGPLLRSRVSFYDERRNVRRAARSRQEQRLQTARIRHVAQLLEFYF